jgi:hypothetical protein
MAFELIRDGYRLPGIYAGRIRKGEKQMFDISRTRLRAIGPPVTRPRR